jgi:hypothetical protein
MRATLLAKDSLKSILGAKNAQIGAFFRSRQQVKSANSRVTDRVASSYRFQRIVLEKRSEGAAPICRGTPRAAQDRLHERFGSRVAYVDDDDSAFTTSGRRDRSGEDGDGERRNVAREPTSAQPRSIATIHMHPAERTDRRPVFVRAVAAAGALLLTALSPADTRHAPGVARTRLPSRDRDRERLRVHVLLDANPDVTDPRASSATAECVRFVNRGPKLVARVRFVFWLQLPQGGRSADEPLEIGGRFVPGEKQRKTGPTRAARQFQDDCRVINRSSSVVDGMLRDDRPDPTAYVDGWITGRHPKPADSPLRLAARIDKVHLRRRNGMASAVSGAVSSLKFVNTAPVGTPGSYSAIRCRSQVTLAGIIPKWV